MTGLFVAASLAQILGGIVAIAYNVLLRQALQQSLSPNGVVMTWSKIYFVTATSLSIGVGIVLTRRLKAAAEDGKAAARYPVMRAALSSVLWLGSIPVLTVAAFVGQGGVHPIGYPHFVASIVIAWLIATTYSSLFNVLLVAGQDQLDVALRPLANLLPVMACGVPVMAGVIFLCFVQPWRFAPEAVRELNGLFVALMTAGGYGFVYCCRVVERIAGRNRVQ